jgi:hypothetical protein
VHASEIVKLYVPGETKLAIATITVPPVRNSDFLQFIQLAGESFGTTGNLPILT